jgi:ABC-2 type transport system ATP-binding protein
MKSVITLTNLTKQYGRARGVEDITLYVPVGTIFGFLGPNGAGKSTTISMLINLTKPTSGSIKIFGKDNQKFGQEIRKDIGFLSSDMALDGHLTGWQQLEYFGKLRGQFDATYVQKLAKKLDSNLQRKQSTLSRGNRQKIGLISALMHKPKLLILDEPTSGLDPLIQAAFNKIITEHQAAGHTTFISSHVLSEIQELCDHVAFIREGKLIASTTLDELKKTAPKHIRIVTDDTSLPAALKKLRGISKLQTSQHILSCGFTGDSNALLKLLSKHAVSDISIQPADLESSFMAFYEEEHA